MSVPSNAAAARPERLRRASEAIDRLKTLILWTATLGALAAFVCLVVREVRVIRTVVDPIAVPEALRQRGYTPEVMSTVLIDRIAKMTEVAVARKHRNTVAAGWRTADVVVPTLNISLSATAGLFENLLEMPDTRISGEVVSTAGGPERYRLTLRVSAAKDGWQVIEVPSAAAYSGWTAAEPVDGLVDPQALALLLKIDPLSAASFVYVTQAEAAKTAAELGDRHQHGAIVHAINRCLEDCAGQDRAAAYVLWANLLARAADLNDAPALRMEALEKFDRAAATGALKSDDYTKWGDILIAVGREAEGFARYDEAADLYRSDFRVPYNRGVRLAKLGRHEQAIAQFEHSADLDASREWTFTAWGNALLSMDRCRDAETKFRAAILLDGGIGAAYRGLADALAAQGGREDEARRMRTRADLLDPPAVVTPVSLTPPRSPAPG